ncbi:ROK family protein [bacterium]|nr:ROK family protein [bacterium]
MEINGERGNKYRFRIVGNAADFYTLLFRFSSLRTLSMTPDDQFVAPLFAGVDVGGTNVKIGLVDNHGKIVADTKFPTSPNETPDVAIVQAREEFNALIESTGFQWSDVAAAGLGTPGPMDIHRGVILTPTNLPGWHNFPIQGRLAEVLGKPVTYANDAGAAAFGEFWVGGGQQHSSMVMITLGTGVGGGIIIDDISVDGANSHGAEIGHIVIDTRSDARICGCGQAGHLEAYASATALVDRTREAMGNPDAGTVLRDLIGETSPLSALMVATAADEGDPLAMKLVSETAVYLGRGIAQLAHLIDPAAFILGGAMNFGGSDSPLGVKFLNEVKAEVRRLVFPVLGERLVLNYAKLGSEAGFVGAAGLARSQYNRTR